MAEKRRLVLPVRLRFDYVEGTAGPRACRAGPPFVRFRAPPGAEVVSGAKS